MYKIIHHTVQLPATSERLYNMFLDPSVHADITGQPVTIGREAGAVFRAFDGKVTGTVLSTVPGRHIVLMWRGGDWKTGDRDSIVILSFLPEKGEGAVELVHIGVPERDFDEINRGWKAHYWTPWRELLEREQRGASKRAA